MKMIEALKEEIKNSLKEIEGKSSKKWKKSINFLQKAKKNKQVMETVQDLKIEIEAIKKTQTDGILEIENFGLNEEELQMQV